MDKPKRKLTKEEVEEIKRRKYAGLYECMRNPYGTKDPAGPVYYGVRK